MNKLKLLVFVYYSEQKSGESKLFTSRLNMMSHIRFILWKKKLRWILKYKHSFEFDIYIWFSKNRRNRIKFSSFSMWKKKSAKKDEENTVTKRSQQGETTAQSYRKTLILDRFRLKTVKIIIKVQLK